MPIIPSSRKLGVDSPFQSKKPLQPDLLRHPKPSRKKASRRSFNANDKSDDDCSSSSSSEEDNTIPQTTTLQRGIKKPPIVITNGHQHLDTNPLSNEFPLSSDLDSMVEVTVDPHASLDGVQEDKVGKLYVPKPRSESERKIITRNRLNTEDIECVADAIHASRDAKIELEAIRKRHLEERKRLSALAKKQAEEDRVCDYSRATIFEIDSGGRIRAASEATEVDKPRETVLSRIRNNHNKNKDKRYVRPEMRVQLAKTAAMEGINSPNKNAGEDSFSMYGNRRDNQTEDGDTGGGDKSPKKIQFGIQDALDFETLTQLRKVFFQKEESSEEEEETVVLGDDGGSEWSFGFDGIKEKNKKDWGDEDEDDGSSHNDGRDDDEVDWGADLGAGGLGNDEKTKLEIPLRLQVDTDPDHETKSDNEIQLLQDNSLKNISRKMSPKSSTSKISTPVSSVPASKGIVEEKKDTDFGDNAGDYSEGRKKDDNDGNNGLDDNNTGEQNIDVDDSNNVDDSDKKISSADAAEAEVECFESRGLDLDEFIHEFGHIIGADLSRQQLQMMFMKIDANSDGDVDWDEFTNWLLKMEAGAHSMTDDVECGDLISLHEQKGESKLYHSGMISSLTSVKLPAHAYVTGGRDGTFRFWNATTLDHIRTVSIVESNFHYTKLNADRKSIPGAETFMKGGVAQLKTSTKKMWISDVVVMTLCNKLAVASADRMITFFDLYTMEVSCRLRNLTHPPMSLAYHTNVTNTRQYLTFGDDVGYIHCLKLKPQFNFDEGLDKDGNDAFEYWKGKSDYLERQGLISYYRHKLHKEWITRVCHIGDLQPSILTCSLDKTVKFFNVDKQTAERTFSGHKSGVQDLVYVRSTKCMASCGGGRAILTWNPHTCSSMQTLHGHLAPVTHLAVDEFNSRLISMSLDKAIKFWDTATWRCMQTTMDHTNYRPDNSLSALFWDAEQQQLLTAGNRIKLWHHKGSEGRENFTSHSAPICAALYNSNFQQVVSGDNSSVVQVWNLEGGQMVFRFDRLHGDSKITSMAFDWSMRRLITGAHDGSIRMWNFSNGQQLKEMNPSSEDDSDNVGESSLDQALNNDSEVTAVQYILEQGGTDDIAHKFIVSVGWDRKVRMYVDDDEEEVEPHRTLPAPGFHGHSDDILCVQHCEPMLLATGSYDGEIVIWSLASGSGRFFLRLSDYVESNEELERIQKQKEEQENKLSLANSLRKKIIHTKNQRSSRGSNLLNDLAGDVLDDVLQDIDENSSSLKPSKPEGSHTQHKQYHFGASHRKIVEDKKNEKAKFDRVKKIINEPRHHHTAHAAGVGDLNPILGKGERSDSEVDTIGDVMPDSKADALQDEQLDTLKKKFVKAKGGARKTIRHEIMEREVEMARRRIEDAKKTDIENLHANLGMNDSSDIPNTSDNSGKSAIECLLFLARKRVGETLGQTLVSSGADSKIRFWSVKDGSLCHVMKSCHPGDASVTCMTSDEKGNDYLFTGCAGGYVKVWSLKSLEKAAGHRLHRRFSVTGDEKFESNNGVTGSTSNHSNWVRAASIIASESKSRKASDAGRVSIPDTSVSPSGGAFRIGASKGASTRQTRSTYAGRQSRVGSLGGDGSGRGRRNSMVESDYILPKVYEIAFWKAHTGPLVSIQHVGIWGEKELLLTASTDCNVSVWTLKGAHIGIFGQTATWSLINSNHWMDTKEHPVDRFSKHSHGGKSRRDRGRGRGGLTSDGTEISKKRSEKNGKGENDKTDDGGDGLDSLSGDDDESLSSSTSSDDGVADGEEEFNKYKDKLRRKEMRRFLKKTNPKFLRKVKNAESRLENYYYAYARAKLERKIMMYQQQVKKDSSKENGGSAPVPTSKSVWGEGKSLLMQNILWNQRWGAGISIKPPEVGGESEIDKNDKSIHINNEKRKEKLERMKELRSNYVHVAHQLHVHKVGDVEHCRGHELVRQRKTGGGNRKRGDKWLKW